MAPLSGHLSLLWDHLVNRAIRAENSPTARFQHLLDDLDLLLATASDLMHSCAKALEQNASEDLDKVFTVSLTLAEALTVQAGQWAIIVEENHFPAKFAKLFRADIAHKYQGKHALENATLEDKLEALGSISITKAETIEETDPLWDTWDRAEEDDKNIVVEGDDEELDSSTPKELRVVLERLPDETPDIPSDKMDFVIVDRMFYCSVSGCDEAKTGFTTLSDLKHHFDSTHSLISLSKRYSFKQEYFDEDQAGDFDEDSLGPTLNDDDQAETETEYDDQVWESEDSEIDDEKADESYIPSGQSKKTAKANSNEVTAKSAPRRPLILGDLPLGYVPKEGEARPPLTCHVCDFFCYSRMDLESHTRTQHPGVDPFKCDLCEFTGSKKRFLLAHIVSRHPSHSPYECDVCGRKFTRKLFVDKHRRKHFELPEEKKSRKNQKKEKVVKNKSPINSENEEDANVDQSNAVDTKRKRAPPTRFVILGDLPLGVQLREGDERPPLRCHVCDFKCFVRMDLESHTKTQHPGFDPFKCDLCEFTSPRKALLIAHITSKHPIFRPHQCKICGRKFARLMNLKAHRRTHEPKPARDSREELLKPREVMVDGVKMVRQYKWQRLKGRKNKTTSKVKSSIARTEPVESMEPRPPPSQKCHLCEFTCRNRMDLESHTKTQHPGCDPFKCSFCEFTTPLKRFLLSHERRHVKAFKCDVCERRFPYKHHLETHMASHSTVDTVMCHLCGKGFKCQKYLTKHLKHTHSNNDAYLCGNCGQGFKHHSTYQVHTTKHCRQNLSEEEEEQRPERSSRQPKAPTTSQQEPSQAMIDQQLLVQQQQQQQHELASQQLQNLAYRSFLPGMMP